MDLPSTENTSNGATGGTSLNAGSMRGGGGEGLGGEKCCRSVLLNLLGEEVFSSAEKQSRALPAAIFQACHSNRVSTSARNWDQCTLLVD